jgi:hypothetical protein
VVKVVPLKKLHFVGIYTRNTDGTRLAFYEVVCLPELVKSVLLKKEDT